MAVAYSELPEDRRNREYRNRALGGDLSSVDNSLLRSLQILEVCCSPPPLRPPPPPPPPPRPPHSPPQEIELSRSITFSPMAAAYSELPEDVIEKIATEHMEETFPQWIAFSRVCKSWRSVALRHRHRRRRRLPCLHIYPKSTNLLLRHRRRRHGHPPSLDHSFFSLATRRIHTAAFFDNESMINNCAATKIHIAAFLYNVSMNDCVASKDGWLLFLNYKHAWQQAPPLLLYLLNPITGSTVALPPLDIPAAAKRLVISKAIISDDDNSDVGRHVFVLFKDIPDLAWCKVEYGGGGGGHDWKFTSLRSWIPTSYAEDAAYFGGKLYVVDNYQVVYVVDNLLLVTNPSSSSSSDVVVGHTETIVTPVDVLGQIQSFCRLCRGADGQLLKIVYCRCRRRRDDDQWVAFELFKLVDDDRRWERVSNLDGFALFLGSHHSFAVPAAQSTSDFYYTENGVRENRIYFALNPHLSRGRWLWDKSICGVFNLADGKSQRFNVSPRHQKSNYNWFLPMPW